MTQPLVALTGATGFVGRHLLADLTRRGYRVRVLLRRPAEIGPEASSAVIGDLARPQAMSSALEGVDAVIHSAGLAHAMSGRPEDDYRAINTEGTLALARAAERAKVRRFVFLSSIRAQTGPSATGMVDESRPPEPTDAYGRSKLEAEQGLAGSGMDWVALRPTLVYGTGVKGNMAALLALAAKPWPLPFGSLTARRSLLALENLAEAVAHVLAHPEPLRRPLIVCDPQPVTLPAIVTALRRGLGRAPGLLPVPESLLAAGLRLAGKGEAAERLCGSLEASPAALRALGWRPALTTQEGLERLARNSRSGG